MATPTSTSLPPPRDGAAAGIRRRQVGGGRLLRPRVCRSSASLPCPCSRRRRCRRLCRCCYRCFSCRRCARSDKNGRLVQLLDGGGVDVGQIGHSPSALPPMPSVSSASPRLPMLGRWGSPTPNRTRRGRARSHSATIGLLWWSSAALLDTWNPNARLPEEDLVKVPFLGRPPPGHTAARRDARLLLDLVEEHLELVVIP